MPQYCAPSAWHCTVPSTKATGAAVHSSGSCRKDAVCLPHLRSPPRDGDAGPSVILHPPLGGALAPNQHREQLQQAKVGFTVMHFSEWVISAVREALAGAAMQGVRRRPSARRPARRTALHRCQLTIQSRTSESRRMRATKESPSCRMGTDASFWSAPPLPAGPPPPPQLPASSPASSSAS